MPNNLVQHIQIREDLRISKMVLGEIGMDIMFAMSEKENWSRKKIYDKHNMSSYKFDKYMKEFDNKLTHLRRYLNAT